MYLWSCVKQDIEQFRCRTLYFNCYLDRILFLSNCICPKARDITLIKLCCPFYIRRHEYSHAQSRSPSLRSLGRKRRLWDNPLPEARNPG